MFWNDCGEYGTLPPGVSGQVAAALPVAATAGLSKFI